MESRYTHAGASADHRLPLASQRMGDFLSALEQEFSKLGMEGVSPSSASPLDPKAARFAEALAKDLYTNRGQSLVVAGDHLDAGIHARVLALNERLGALGTTLSVIQAPSELDPAGGAGLEDLAGAMGSGAVEVLIVLGGNPCYDAPADLGFTESLVKVPFKAHLSVYANETSRQCDWHMPKAHFLESWGDARAYDGTYSVVQPMIEPLHGGKSALELLSMLVDENPDGGVGDGAFVL